MNIIRSAVERPVTTMMFYSSLILLGIISLWTLPRELFPTVTFPELLIVTRYGAAAPEEIENIITKVIEEQAGTVPNLRKVRSISKEGISVVILEFNWGADMSMAHLAVREKIDLIKDRLPTEAEEPIVQRYNPFAQPMMILSLSGDMPLSEITRLADSVIKKRLQKVDGVASATVSGGQTREIWVEVDLDKMQASNISISGIVDSLKTSNINYPAGTTQGKFYEYLVRTIGEFKDVAEVGKTVVAVDIPRESAEYAYKSFGKSKGTDTFQPRLQRLVPLNSVAEVKDTFKEVESYSRHNGKLNVSIAIQKQFDSNTIKTAKRVRRVLKELSLSLPKEMKVEVVYDESQFIQDALTNVINDAVLGGLLAFFVLLFFLRNLKDASLAASSLPVSFFVVFSSLYFAGRSINAISLAGISLAIGSVIDNSICVMDNIDKYRHKLGNMVEAAVEGSSSVAMAQTASMLTNIVVFLPLLFAKGVAQQLFKDLFFTSVVANIIALVVALTLIPRIAAYQKKRESASADSGTLKSVSDQEQSGDDVLIGVGGKISRGSSSAGSFKTSFLQKKEKGIQKFLFRLGFFGKWLNWLFQGMTDERAKKLDSFYEKSLRWSIQNRKKVFYWVVLLMLFSLTIFYFKSKIFMPSVDQGQFMIKVNMPVGTRLDVTNRVMGRIETVVLKMSEVRDVLVRVGSGSEEAIESLGSHQGECVVTLDREKTHLVTENAILMVKKKLENISFEGAEIEYLLQDSSMKAVTGAAAPIAITLKGPDLATLRKLSDEIQEILKNIQGTEGVKTSLALPSYETRVAIDKDRASAFSLSVSDIARASLIGIRGFVATFFKEQGKEIAIRVRAREEDRNKPTTIQRLALRTQQGFMVPLGDVAQISGGLGPSEIQRIDQQRSVTVSAQVFGRSVGEVIEEADQKLSPYKNLKDYSVELGGTKQEMKESFGGLFLAFMLAVILTYMIMAAGFESLLHPFLIMITVPLGVIGVALTLLVSFTPLSAPVALGTILLGGIVVNNGIVMLDYVNYLRKEEGKELVEAIVSGCRDRLRPVLMTAITTILSVAPIALGIGEGTEMSSPMALVTFGGLFISTLLTLIVLPLLYLFVEERREKKA